MRKFVFYDGKCGLCDRSVAYLVKATKPKALWFAKLNHNTALKLLSEEIRSTDSVVYYNEAQNMAYLKSSAILNAISDTGKSILLRWLCKGLLWVPQSIRDSAYDIIAHNRTRFFKNENRCAILPADLKQQFID